MVKVTGMKLAAVRRALETTRGDVNRNVEVVTRLQAVREELAQLKKALDGLV